jgi:D-alanyl-D-alanine carboxypeptidase (penicillin-binding protein 5/6)
LAPAGTGGVGGRCRSAGREPGPAACANRQPGEGNDGLPDTEAFPLSGAQNGFTITITAAQAQAGAQNADQDQSEVAVSAGEQLTERQLLEALLIPSGNNVARILAPKVAGSATSFVDEMNDEAGALGMDHTTYTDPSGFDPGTVSTAADQLRVFEQAMRFPVFRQIVSMPRVTLPVGGTLDNFNPLIADGFAGKTGSDSAAGGCLAFFTVVTIDGGLRAAMGVVMGQGQGSDTSALLAAAGGAAGSWSTRALELMSTQQPGRTHE